MKYEPLDPEHKQTGVYVSNEQTPVDVGDLIRVQHSDATIHYAEVIAIETGDAGEVLVFQYIKTPDGVEQAPLFAVNRPFPSN